MKIQRLLRILDPPVLQVRARQRKDGVRHGRLAGARQRQHQLLEGVPRLLAEDDEVREDVAEVVDERAAAVAVREFREGRRAEVEPRRADGARGDHGQVGEEGAAGTWDYYRRAGCRRLGFLSLGFLLLLSLLLLLLFLDDGGDGVMVIPEIPRPKGREGEALEGAVGRAEDDGVVGRVAQQAAKDAVLADEEVGLGEATGGAEGQLGRAARRVRVAPPPLARLDGLVGALGVVLDAAGAFGALFVTFFLLELVSAGCLAPCPCEDLRRGGRGSVRLGQAAVDGRTFSLLNQQSVR